MRVRFRTGEAGMTIGRNCKAREVVKLQKLERQVKRFFPKTSRMNTALLSHFTLLTYRILR